MQVNCFTAPPLTIFLCIMFLCPILGIYSSQLVSWYVSRGIGRVRASTFASWLLTEMPTSCMGVMDESSGATKLSGSSIFTASIMSSSHFALMPCLVFKDGFPCSDASIRTSTNSLAVHEILVCCSFFTFMSSASVFLRSRAAPTSSASIGLSHAL